MYFCGHNGQITFDEMEKIRLATQSDIEAVTDIYDRIHKMEAEGKVRIG